MLLARAVTLVAARAVTLVAALAAHCQAAPKKRPPIPQNIHIGDFRGFGEKGCLVSNLGIYTVIQGDFTNGECKRLPRDQPDIKSMLLVDLIDGCKMTFYESDNCVLDHGVHERGRYMQTNVCYESNSTKTSSFKAWSMEFR